MPLKCNIFSFFFFTGRRSWKLCLEVCYKSQITASLASQRKMINWGKICVQILFLSTSDKLKQTTVTFRTFPNDVHLFFCRFNDDEPLTWKESFDKLLSSQSKSSRSHLMQKCFDHSFIRSLRWQPDVNSLLLFPDGLCLFRAFLVSEFSEENIAFYLACEDYKETKPSKLATKAKKIYDEFVCCDAPREVNTK